MKLEMKCAKALCSLDFFKINDIEADYDDFGDKEDLSPWGAEDFACGNMTFTPKEPTEEILNKYGINKEEYCEVCDKLDCLSFGKCGWCI